jgi:hypothetical protein
MVMPDPGETLGRNLLAVGVRDKREILVRGEILAFRETLDSQDSQEKREDKAHPDLQCPLAHKVHLDQRD